MDVKEAIEKRRSIRGYSGGVSGEQERELLEAARLAPSGNNAQPWKFMPVKDTETKESLRENKIFMQNWVYDAPLIMVCCADPREFSKKLGRWDHENETRAVRDLSIACGFMVLRAAELGLGTCFVGWMEKEKIKEVLGIPKEFSVPYVIAVGEPGEDPKEKKTKAIEEIIF